ncbi:MAG: aminoglycoside 6-adenylyltransferase [Solirubrobacteraceae bacterium]
MERSNRIPELIEKRQDEVEQVSDQVAAWAVEDPGIRGIGMAGSWARGEGRMDSDVDIIVLATEPERFTDSDEWLKKLGAPPVIRRQQWGVVAERRVQLPSGLEVEFGIAPLSWANTDPVDSGTEKVVREGFRILYDPDSQLGRLQTSVATN